MTSQWRHQVKFRTSEESNETYIVGVQFLSILDKYLKNYGNINAIWPLFGTGSYQIWPYHVTQSENLSFSYLNLIVL